MNILNNYILKKFLKTFVFVVAIMILVVVVIDFTEKNDKFIKFILYKIIEGILDLQISRETVPDFATAKTDLFKI